MFLCSSFVFAESDKSFSNPALEHRESKIEISSSDRLDNELPRYETLSGGKKVNAHFYKAELSDVLRTLANWSKLSVILSPKIYGTVTMRIRNIPVKTAFYSLVRAHDLYILKKDGLIKVITRKEYAAYLRAKKVHSQVFRTRFIPAERFYKVVRQLLTPEIGRAVFDERTSQVVVTDLPERIAHIKELLQKTDIRNDTIRVQAQIIEIDYSDESEVGAFYKMVDMKSHRTMVDARFASNRAIITQTSGGLKIQAVIDDVPFPNVNTPKSIELGLSALGIDGEAITVSSPSLYVEENAVGTLMVGQEIPYPVAQASNFGIVETKFEFVKAGMILKLRPRVENKFSDNPLIHLDLEIENSSAEFIRFSDSETSKAPQKSMSKARLSVRCFSGQSV
ncbi:MAG: hypothetical protein D6767_05080, partial [Candidatus Hydrogenedentota bacterium]